MRVIINQNVYGITRKQFKGLLKVAEKVAQMRIYAVEKDGIAEMKNDRYEDMESLEKAVSEYQSKGFVVYWNGN